MWRTGDQDSSSLFEGTTWFWLDFLFINLLVYCELTDGWMSRRNVVALLTPNGNKEADANNPSLTAWQDPELLAATAALLGFTATGSAFFYRKGQHELSFCRASRVTSVNWWALLCFGFQLKESEQRCWHDENLPSFKEKWTKLKIKVKNHST